MTHLAISSASALLPILAWAAIGCGSSLGDPTPPPIADAPAPDAPEDTLDYEADTPPLGPDGEALTGVDFGVSDGPAPIDEVTCVARSAASELQQVYLAFAFDVSGSMGGNDANRYHTKWVPVVAASRAFFAEPESAAISASVTFFPDADEETRCMDASYLTPDVPLAPLPNPKFSEAIDALGYTLGSNAWRGSTPTLAAFNGTVASLQAIAEQGHSTRAVVMVTDGMPQGCAVNDVQLVADAVRASGVMTFVVGVANPPGDTQGDNLGNLNVIAEAGGTQQAFIVATGDPQQTEADFKAVIDQIRGVAIACNIEIPLPPAGTVFIPDQVNVTYFSGDSDENLLSYDPDCSTPDTWRYDDAQNPTSIILCSNTCGAVQADVTARLSVEFGCARRGLPR